MGMDSNDCITLHAHKADDSDLLETGVVRGRHDLDIDNWIVFGD